MLPSAGLLRALSTQRSFSLTQCFGWPVFYILDPELLGLSYYSLLRLHFEVLAPNVKIVLSSFFIYEMKVYSVEVLKFRSFLFLM